MRKKKEEQDHDLYDWSAKSQSSKGGTVNHSIRYGLIKKPCGCYMGEGCQCKRRKL